MSRVETFCSSVPATQLDVSRSKAAHLVAPDIGELKPESWFCHLLAVRVSVSGHLILKTSPSDVIIPILEMREPGLREVK